MDKETIQKNIEWARNKISEEFSDIVFKEKTHQYFLGKTEYKSVSSTIHKFEVEEDWDAIAEKYAIDHGGTKQFWLDAWEFNNLKATTQGTLVHEYGESLSWLRAGFPDKITKSCKPKYIAKHGWLIPTRKKEEAVLKFWDELPKCLHFVMAEAKVYSGKGEFAEKLSNNYAGTFDILLYFDGDGNDDKAGFVVFDYKTNQSLTNDYNQKNKKTLLDPFGDMIEEPMSLYTLQLSAYTQCLRNIGINVIARRIVWLKDDGTYSIIPLRDETKRLMNALK